MPSKITFQQFKERSKIKHCNKYFYPQSSFDNIYSKIRIICPEHGEFLQVIKNHLQGSGCKICAKLKQGLSNSYKFSDDQVNYIKNDYLIYSNISRLSKVFKVDRDVIKNQLIKLGIYKKNKSNKKIYKNYNDISSYFIYSLNQSAKNRNLKLEISPEDIWNLYIYQDRKCALSGWDILFSLNREKNTASVDRINSSQGYTIDNIQIVHKDINILKMNWSEEYLYKMCNSISGYRKNLIKKKIFWEEDVWNDTLKPYFVCMEDVTKKNIRVYEA